MWVWVLVNQPFERLGSVFDCGKAAGEDDIALAVQQPNPADAGHDVLKLHKILLRTILVCVFAIRALFCCFVCSVYVCVCV